MIRGGARDFLRRWAEVGAAGAALAAGLWLALALGGYVLAPAGMLLSLIAAGWLWQALGRARFRQGQAAPGLVALDEAELTYYGPGLGGAMGLDDIEEIRLVTVRGRRLWWLKGAEAKPVLIPVDAEGNMVLFDAFTTLPGLSQGRLLAALEGKGAGTPGLVANTAAFRPVWRRPRA